MRSLLGLLRSTDADDPQPPQPGLASLPALIAGVRNAGLPPSWTSRATLAPLSAGLDLAAYGILQEALTNTLKHAVGATHAVLRIHCTPGTLHLSVADDGRGSERADHVSGHGLIGMRERVALYGGDLTAGPRTDGGVLVEARLPIGEVAP